MGKKKLAPKQGKQRSKQRVLLITSLVQMEQELDLGH